MLADEDASRLELFLFSEAEQRIPHAARQKFFTERLREFFTRKPLDLALYMAEMPPGSIVYGPPALIEALKKRLGHV
jgi:hypothetical protein